MKRFVRVAVLATAVGVGVAYAIYPWWCRRSATAAEATSTLAGDGIVADATTGYTLAVSIAAPAERVWPWLVQMGQGRGGFYTHEWLENLIGADIHNADTIRPELQQLKVGDRIRLTPDPYLGGPGQYIEAAIVNAPSALVFRQALPGGGLTTWAYILQPAERASTRLIFRRRGTRPSLFDRFSLPGYYYMDAGMLRGIKIRAERVRGS